MNWILKLDDKRIYLAHVAATLAQIDMLKYHHETYLLLLDGITKTIKA